jgi:hypothetical protein
LAEHVAGQSVPGRFPALNDIVRLPPLQSVKQPSGAQATGCTVRTVIINNPLKNID